MDFSPEQLAQLRFFNGESPDAIEWLLDKCTRLTLDEGEVLLEPGQDNEKLYVVLHGSLSVRLSQNGDPISTLVQGDCVGEMSVIDSAHTSAWVVARSAVELMVLDADHVWALITRSHTVAVNLLCILSDRVRRDNRLIEKSEQLKSFYEYHARVDALTGLNNRRWLDETMVRLTRRSDISGQPLGIIMADIDHFKRYNDVHGHLVGDIALHAVAQTLKRSIRPNDLAARYGGEEFVVLLPDTDLSTAEEIAHRLCKAVRATLVRSNGGRLLESVTISAGVTYGKPGATPGDLMGAADAAMYRAKHLGRDCVSI